MRAQHYIRRTADGFDVWDVRRLVVLAGELPVVKVPIDDIPELDRDYWYDHGYEPTVRSVAEHARLIAQADPDWPIILSYDGRVMDGMHRVARALLDGRTTVPARRFVKPVEPDQRGVTLRDLPL